MIIAPARYRFTIDDYHRMEDAGVLSDDRPVELIDGEIIAMSPVGSRHVACVNRLDDLLHERLPSRSVINQVQSPVVLGEHYEPKPDIAVLRFRADYYAEALPRPADVLLLIEVADSSLAFDQEVKLPIYARAGILEVWIADLDGGRIERYTSPTHEGYAQKDSAGHGATLAAATLPALVIRVDEALGAPC
ncbi:MAG: Uma2 family endonuclease [Dehalococcoidia bacterium]